MGWIIHKLAGGLEVVNRKFNEDLQRQINGTLPVGHVYQLGRPGGILRAAGVEDLPVELESGLLFKKSSEDYHGKHPFDISKIKDLPTAINSPIAVFDDDTRHSGGKRILTELQHNGHNFMVAMRVRTDKKSRKDKVSVNNIRSIFPKDRVNELFDWFYGRNDLLRWVDKEKARNFVSIQSTYRTVDGNEGRATDKVMAKIDSFQNPVYRGQAST